MKNLHVALFDAHKLSTQIEQMLIESQGELTPEIENLCELKDWNERDLKAETDLLAMSLERMNQSINYYNDQIEHLEKLVKGLERSEARLSMAIKETLEKLNLEAIAGDYRAFSLRKTPPKVEILDELAVTDEFKEIKLTESVKKREIAAALNSGRELPWARLVSNRTLTIKTSKPKLKESDHE